MDDAELENRLRLLLADNVEPPADPDFACRVVALAAHELKIRQSRRRAIGQVVRESLALVTFLGSFALLARNGPRAGFGDAISIGSPAFFGIIILLIWALAMVRGPVALSR